MDPAEVFRKSMEDALANLDKVTEEVRQAKEKAIDEQIAAREEKTKIEREAHQISEAYIDKHRKEYDARIRDETLFKVAKTLILDGRTSVEVFKWLGISEKMMTDVWFELGFSKLGDHVAHVGYEGNVRSGYVIFYRDDSMLKFPYEMGAGTTLSIIDVPAEENWTSSTKLPLEDRLPILQFIGERVVRDQATGYHYIIHKDSINIIL